MQPKTGLPIPRGFMVPSSSADLHTSEWNNLSQTTPSRLAVNEQRQSLEIKVIERETSL